jgi:hypothetical protein
LAHSLVVASAADTPEKRFFALGDAAKGSFAAGKITDAQKYAEEGLMSEKTSRSRQKKYEIRLA